MQAIRLFYLGFGREQVLQICVVSEESLRKWVKAFNHGGIDALLDKKGKVGRPKKKVTGKIAEQIRQAVENPQSIGHEHVTCVKIHGYLTQKGYGELKYHDVWREVRANNYVLKFPRRQAQPDYDEKKQQEWLVERKAYVQKHEQWQKNDKVELWFCDESGFEGDPRPRQTWAKKGSKTTLPYSGKHLRQNVIGAVCPQSGKLFGQIWSGVDGKVFQNTGVFQKFLDEMAREVPDKPEVRQIICLDNASWHKAKCLNWHHFEPCFQPPYSPDLNPIEQLWRVMKADFFAGFIAKNKEALIQRLCTAIKHYLQSPNSIKSTCSTHSLFQT